MRESVFAQDLQVLGDGRLRQPELSADHLDHGPRGVFALGQQLDDPAAYRITDDVEGMHQEPV